jgi:hypothetical protein
LLSFDDTPKSFVCGLGNSGFVLQLISLTGLHSAEMATLAIESKTSDLGQENNCAISLLAPIRRLPAEMLSEIFMLAITEHNCSALRLTHICRSWRLVLLGMSRIWSKIKVGTWTGAEEIECLLERTGGDYNGCGD